MKKTLFFCLALMFSSLSLASDCELFNYKFDGEWTYIEKDIEHTIEIAKETSYLTLDGEQKEYSICYQYKFLDNSFDISFKKDFKRISFKIPKNDTSNEPIRISIGRETYDLIKKQPVIDTSAVAHSKKISWEPEIGIDHHLFPSLLLATATWSNPEGQKRFRKSIPNAEYLGDLNSPVKVILKNLELNSKIKIVVDLGPVANIAVWEGQITKSNNVYVIKPKVDLNYQQLIETKQPIHINAKTSLYIDDVKVGDKLETITVRSINDVPLFSFDEKGNIFNDYRYTLAAFVNENNPMIDSLLREALETRVVSSFSGYQSGEAGVYEQLFALWNVMQRRGMKYSSIGTPTGVSQKVFSQYVRFFDDSTSNSQANCIDGTVLFASVLRRIGINSKIVMIPGHAFLAFDLDTEGKRQGYLETTLMGSTDINLLSDRKRLRDVFFGKKTKNEASLNSYQAALFAGLENMRKNQMGFTAKNPIYSMIDIGYARSIGVSPINK